MAHLNNTKKIRKGKHLNYEERIKIQALSKAGMKSEEIAPYIGCSGRTVRRELDSVGTCWGMEVMKTFQKLKWFLIALNSEICNIYRRR